MKNMWLMMSYILQLKLTKHLPVPASMDVGWTLAAGWHS